MISGFSLLLVASGNNQTDTSDIQMVDAISERLMFHGYNVLHATDEEMALECISAQKIDLVIMFGNMDFDGDGDRLIRRIRSNSSDLWVVAIGLKNEFAFGPTGSKGNPNIYIHDENMYGILGWIWEVVYRFSKNRNQM